MESSVLITASAINHHELFLEFGFRAQVDTNSSSGPDRSARARLLRLRVVVRAVARVDWHPTRIERYRAQAPH